MTKRGADRTPRSPIVHPQARQGKGRRRSSQPLNSSSARLSLLQPGGPGLDRGLGFGHRLGVALGLGLGQLAPAGPRVLPRAGRRRSAPGPSPRGWSASSARPRRRARPARPGGSASRSGPCPARGTLPAVSQRSWMPRSDSLAAARSVTGRIASASARSCLLDREVGPELLLLGRLDRVAGREERVLAARNRAHRRVVVLAGGPPRRPPAVHQPLVRRGRRSPVPARSTAPRPP